MKIVSPLFFEGSSKIKKKTEKMVKFGPNLGQIRFHPVSSGFIRFHPVSSGFIRFHPVSSGFIRSNAVNCKGQKRSNNIEKFEI
jgi:hypothetical protein